MLNHETFSVHPDQITWSKIGKDGRPTVDEDLRTELEVWGSRYGFDLDDECEHIPEEQKPIYKISDEEFDRVMDKYGLSSHETCLFLGVKYSEIEPSQ